MCSEVCSMVNVLWVLQCPLSASVQIVFDPAFCHCAASVYKIHCAALGQQRSPNCTVIIWLIILKATICSTRPCVCDTWWLIWKLTVQYPNNFILMLMVCLQIAPLPWWYQGVYTYFSSLCMFLLLIFCCCWITEDSFSKFRKTISQILKLLALLLNINIQYRWVWPSSYTVCHRGHIFYFSTHV